MNKNTLKGFIAGIALTTVVAGSGFAFASANGFVDVPQDQWYSQAVQWAKDHGVMVGTSATTFDPNKPMTRAEFAEAIKNLADQGYIQVPATTTTTTTTNNTPAANSSASGTTGTDSNTSTTGTTVASDTYTAPATTTDTSATTAPATNTSASTATGTTSK